MINCKNCNFIVNRNLKHSIESNTCPSCGQSLISNDDLRKVSEISSELLHGGFNFSAHDLKMLSLFMINKFHKEEREEDTSTVHYEDDLLEDEEAPEYSEDSIRKEIEEDLGLSRPLASEKEGSDDKVDRLKSLARTNPVLNKRGAAVRRVSE